MEFVKDERESDDALQNNVRMENSQQQPETVTSFINDDLKRVCDVLRQE